MAPFPATQLWLTSLAGLAALVLVGALWWLWRLKARREAHERRKAGRQLVDSVKAYAAWMDCQRDEPFAERNPEELSVPEPLRRACEIRDASFPQLGPAMVRLLRSHRAMMDFLWQQNILRMTPGAPRQPIYGEPQYQALRDDQEAAVDAVIMQCRMLIGDDTRKWHRTRSDFIYSSGLSLPSHPGSRP